LSSSSNTAWKFAPVKQSLHKIESQRWLITLVEPIHPLLFLAVISLRIPWAIPRSQYTNKKSTGVISGEMTPLKEASLMRNASTHRESTKQHSRQRRHSKDSHIASKQIRGTVEHRHFQGMRAISKRDESRYIL
jgi:hypothetical protein